jgi:hypothetical protein
MRQEILDALLKHRFVAEETALKLREDKFAQFAYETMFTKDQLRVLEDKQFHNWWNYRTCIYGQMGYRTLQLRFYLANGEARSVPVPSFTGHFKIEVTHKIVKEWEVFLDDRKELNDRRSNASTKAKAVIDSHSSAERLIEAWPEIEPFTPNAPSPRLLPVVPTASLNAIFDLPVEEAKPKAKAKVKA